MFLHDLHLSDPERLVSHFVKLPEELCLQFHKLVDILLKLLL